MTSQDNSDLTVFVQIILFLGTTKQLDSKFIISFECALQKKSHNKYPAESFALKQNSCCPT